MDSTTSQDISFASMIDHNLRYLGEKRMVTLYDGDAFSAQNLVADGTELTLTTLTANVAVFPGRYFPLVVNHDVVINALKWTAANTGLFLLITREKANSQVRRGVICRMMRHFDDCVQFYGGCLQTYKFVAAAIQIADLKAEFHLPDSNSGCEYSIFKEVPVIAKQESFPVSQLSWGNSSWKRFLYKVVVRSESTEANLAELSYRYFERLALTNYEKTLLLSRNSVEERVLEALKASANLRFMLCPNCQALLAWESEIEAATNDIMSFTFASLNGYHIQGIALRSFDTMEDRLEMGSSPVLESDFLPNYHSAPLRCNCGEHVAFRFWPRDLSTESILFYFNFVIDRNEE